MLEKSGLKFKDIRKRYRKDSYSKETYSDLAVYLPIDKAILQMVANHLPNPLDAQKYRIKKIWDGEIDSEVGKAMINTDPNGPLIICISKVQAEKHGLVATGRIFSGTCPKKREVILLNTNEKENIQRVAIFMGQRRENVDKIPVGNVIALEGLKNIKSGETLIDPNISHQMIPFGNVKYVSTPVVTVSIEPEFLRDLDEMRGIIDNLLIEDPNLKFEINEENGEFLLSGMGPLHLEVTANEIKKRGVEVSISEPHAVFKESCLSKSSIIEVRSAEGKNKLELQIERLDDKTVKFFRRTDYSTIKPFEHLKNILKVETGLNDSEISNFWKCDEDQNLLIYQKEWEFSEEYKEMVEEIIDKIHLNGPLCGEKLTEVKISIINLEINQLNEEIAFTELSTLFYDAIKKGLNEAGLVLLEPIYDTNIQLPPEYLKNVLSLMSKFSAKIKEIDQDRDYQAQVDILLPVRYSLEFAEDVRSVTSGRGFWQNEFDSFKKVPSQEAERIVSDLRFHKGIIW
ncbi:MAG: EF-Tu/IF-2/RF-3 family GTPase [Candidatus Lokiarchaeota archaeon]